MGVPGNANALLLTSAAAAGGYQVSRSLRFNSADSVYLSKSNWNTPTNRKKGTLSFWAKRSSLAASSIRLFHAYDGTSSASFDISFNSDHTIGFNFGGGAEYVNKTSAVFRDVSAWYHIVCLWDTTDGTAANRLKIYVNGTQQTLGTTSYPAQNTDAQFPIDSTDPASDTFIGAGYGPAAYFNGYLADIWFIDGLALDPSSFAETDATTGQWIPKTYSGSKGSNGFHLEFADNSAATAAALGKDTSGNGLNWTPNNFSVTAGAGNDSLTDTPTSYGTDTGAGGEVRGNYATLNPLEKGTNVTLSNGNLDATNSVAQNDLVKATIGMSSGKWYAEFLVQSQNSSYATPRIGLAGRSAPVTNDDFGNAANEYAFGVTNNSSLYGRVYNNGSWSGTATAVYPNDIAMCAFDADTGKMWFGVNGTWFNSGNPAAGTNPWFTASMTEPYFFTVHNISTSVVCNFGARAFSYQAPSGFKALCDTNLTAPVIAKPNEVMDVKLYTGNGSSQSITGLAFNPDLVWIKTRSAVEHHVLVDAVRGTSKNLFSSNTSAEETTNPYGSVTAFNSNGFTVGGGSIDQSRVNGNNVTHVGWCWDAGSSTATNTQGSITCQLRANATSGFSVATFTGATTGTIGHGLGVAPSMIIMKARTSNPGANDWFVYHKDVGNTKALLLNSTATPNTYTYWNNTSPTSTVFSIGSGLGTPDWVAYCFAPVTGYSSMGSYVGNGSDSGPFCWCGFRPRYIIIKSSDNIGYWQIYDTARMPYNEAESLLWADRSIGETTNANYGIDILSNGFRLKADTAGFSNYSGWNYIYFAVAESPFQYARAR